jgi:hypothetical protein
MLAAVTASSSSTATHSTALCGKPQVAALRGDYMDTGVYGPGCAESVRAHVGAMMFVVPY